MQTKNIYQKRPESEKDEKISSIKDLDRKMIDQVIAFFISYNTLSTKIVKKSRKAVPPRDIKLIKHNIL